jgi:hypothetical protein
MFVFVSFSRRLSGRASDKLKLAGSQGEKIVLLPACAAAAFRCRRLLPAGEPAGPFTARFQLGSPQIHTVYTRRAGQIDHACKLRKRQFAKLGYWPC